ncbi:MAG: alcohol dehydrogenase catalytic domain-containing protein [Nitrososphaerales archaeon]|nr:alcohol dehydrogenase catalytic domain-containing protein [Nitrososphaerales archaeon]
MKSVLLRRPPGESGIRAQVLEVPIPPLGAGELLVEMKACGLCGTDIEKALGQYTASMPVLGHEAVGVVAAVGNGVKGLKVGDRVFPHHHVACLECYYCRHGSETMCLEYRKSNLDPGGFSEFFRVPAWNVSHGGVLGLPDSVGFDEASLIEPVACCIRALDKCGVSPGDSVLVVGAGPVGMAHALLLLSRKATVMVSDVNKGRIGFAEAAKVGPVIDASKVNVADSVRKETAGRGADLAIVASGNKEAIVQALSSVRRGGKVCLFGVPVKGSVLDYDVSDAYNSEVSIISSYGAAESDTSRALDIISRRTVNLGSLITHRFHIEEFDKGVETVVAGRGMKVVITP